MKVDYATSQRHTRRRLLLIALIACSALFGVAIVRLFTPTYVYVRDRSPTGKCAGNLRQIGLASLMYANEHQGHWPDRFEDMFDEGITSDAFCCPASSDTPAIGPTTQAVAATLSAGGHLSYVYLAKALVDPVPVDVIVAYETPGHHDGLSNVLLGDGHVEHLTSAEMRRLLSVVQSSGTPRPVRWPSLQPYVQSTTMPTSAK